jgi:acyl-CoA dehydrogenase
MYQAQEQLHSFLRNFPNRPVAFFLRCFIFPRGRTYSSPSDELGRKIVDLITRSGEVRERLSRQAYTTIEPGNPIGLLQEALALSETLTPLEQRLRQARKEGLIRSEYLGHQIEEAANAEVITGDEAAGLRSYHEKLRDLMAVDDFPADEIGRAGAASESALEDDGSSSRPVARSAAKSKVGVKKRSSSPRKKAASSDD